MRVMGFSKCLGLDQSWAEGQNRLNEGAVAGKVCLDPGCGHDIVAQLVLGDRACRTSQRPSISVASRTSLTAEIALAAGPSVSPTSVYTPAPGSTVCVKHSAPEVESGRWLQRRCAARG